MFGKILYISNRYRAHAILLCRARDVRQGVECTLFVSMEIGRSQIISPALQQHMEILLHLFW